MPDILLYILVFIVLIGPLMIIHELGHFWGAKAAGVRVEEFGLGFPPRVVKLFERDGTIVGYSVRLKPQVEEHRIRALMTIAVEGNRTDAVIAALRGDPAVGALHSTNGRWDIVAELRADSLASFDQVLGRIRQLEGIASTETSLLLSTYK